MRGASIIARNTREETTMNCNQWLACALTLIAVSAGASETKKSAGPLKAAGSIDLTRPADGFEYTAELSACADYTDGSSACAGGSKAKPKSHWAAINLSRYKGKKEYEKDTVVDSMGFPGAKPSAKAPITANIVQGSIDY